MTEPEPAERPAGAPLFTVVMPVFERPRLVCEAIDSVLAQTDADFELVVVDDGSTDATAEALAAYAQHARLERQANAGPGPARNRGAALARGDYLVFLDSDDLLLPWALATCREVLAAAPPVAFMASAMQPFEDAAVFRATPRTGVAYRRFDDFLASTAAWRSLGAGTLVVRREVFVAAGGFDPSFRHAEDADLSLRLGTAAGFVDLTAPLVLGMRLHAGRMSNDEAAALSDLRRLLAREEHGEYPGAGARARDRRRLITLHLRPAILAALRDGRLPEALALYRRTLRWHLAEWRWAFLLGAPMLALAWRLRRWAGRGDHA